MGPFGDLYLTDNKAKIKSLLKHVTLPQFEAIRIENASLDLYQPPSIVPLSAETFQLQTECMKNLEIENFYGF